MFDFFKICESFSGFQVTYDVTQEIGQRVMSAKVRCHDCTVPSFIALDMEEEYNVLITSFMASGGDGYSMIPENVIETRNYGKHDIFLNYQFCTAVVPLLSSFQNDTEISTIIPTATFI